VLSLVDVTKTYDYRPVLNRVNLTLSEGGFYALTAPNGSGKTTLLQLMAGIVKPSEGKLLWDGQAFQAKARQHVGAVFQAPMVYGDLSAVENLMLFARLYGLARAKTVAAEWVKRVGLEDAAGMKARSFSKGMLQRLAIARSLLHSPRLLLLDEPFDGLDAPSVTLTKALIQERRRAGATIFMVTHQADDAKPADEHLTIRHGGVVTA
jgi:ABC-type multidrug transport system ATPase subunit